MRRGLCWRNAENPDAGPVPGAPRGWRVLFSSSWTPVFSLFGPISPQDLAPILLGVSLGLALERRLNSCQYRRINFAARAGLAG